MRSYSFGLIFPIIVIGCSSTPVDNQSIYPVSVQDSNISSTKDKDVSISNSPAKEFAIKNNQKISESGKLLLNKIFMLGDWSSNCSNTDSIHYRFYFRGGKYMLVQTENMIPIIGAEIYSAKESGPMMVEIKIDAIELGTNSEYIQRIEYKYEPKKVYLRKSSVLFLNGTRTGEELNVYPDASEYGKNSNLIRLSKSTLKSLNYCGATK